MKMEYGVFHLQRSKGSQTFSHSLEMFKMLVYCSDHLKIHMKTHDNQKPFQCTVCNRGYNTAAALTSHMQNHKKDQQQQQQQNGHNNSNSSRASSNNTPSPVAACPSFRCLQCGETFRKPEELQVR